MSSKDLIKFADLLGDLDSGEGWAVNKVKVARGKVVMGEKMRKKVVIWMGGNEELVSQVEEQAVNHGQGRDMAPYLIPY